MKRKRRFTMLAINITAAVCALASVWLPWFNGGDTIKTTVTILFGIFDVMPTTAFTFSVAAAIFVTTGIMIAAAVTALKVFNILGVLFGSAIIGFWTWTSGFPGDPNINRIGIGVFVMLVAVILSIVSLCVFRKRANRN